MNTSGLGVYQCFRLEDVVSFNQLLVFCCDLFSCSLDSLPCKWFIWSLWTQQLAFISLSVSSFGFLGQEWYCVWLWFFRLLQNPLQSNATSFGIRQCITLSSSLFLFVTLVQLLVMWTTELWMSSWRNRKCLSPACYPTSVALKSMNTCDFWHGQVGRHFLKDDLTVLPMVIVYRLHVYECY